jgi:FKBP-type peptidyl-prolyl cis-trans isomerase (trigger factor)
MLTHSLKKLPNNTAEIVVKISWDEIQKEYSAAFDALHRDFSFEGFRKGKVPRAIAEKHIAKETVFQRLIRELLPKIYSDLIKEEKLQPIVSPKIELVKAKENEEWEIKFTIAEKPAIDLGDYKEKIKETKAKAKKADIWVPGKGEEKKAPVKDNQKILNEVLSALMKAVKIEIPDLIIEEELNRRLTALVDDIQKLGLTVDAYLKSKQTTIEQLKEKFSQEIKDTYRLEFILGEIADKEGIKVEQADLDHLFNHLKDEKERKEAQSNAYFYASILRKQKTLDYLTNL